jgi:hypothetical protein
LLDNDVVCTNLNKCCSFAFESNFDKDLCALRLAGLVVDLFSHGVVLPELWEVRKQGLSPKVSEFCSRRYVDKP